jgi:hypothetical protein
LLVAAPRSLDKAPLRVSRPPLPEFVNDHGWAQRSSVSPCYGQLLGTS